jgi:hypothetical protein
LFWFFFFWEDDKKYGNDLIETIDFYDELEIMIKIVKPDLDDLEFTKTLVLMAQLSVFY